MSNRLRLYGLEPFRLLCPGDSPGKNTGVGCNVLLQGTFLTQGLNLLFLQFHTAGGLFTAEPPWKPHYLGKAQKTSKLNFLQTHAYVIKQCLKQQKSQRMINSEYLERNQRDSYG